MSREIGFGVIGATGAAGGTALSILAERGYENVRAFGSPRSAGSSVRFGDKSLLIEKTIPETLRDLDIGLFAVGAGLSRVLIPDAVADGVVCIDKSSAFRMDTEVPLIVPEVNGALTSEHSGLIAVPNCCTIPLTCVLKPLLDVAGLKSVRVATYQSVSGAGKAEMEKLAQESPGDHDLRMDWAFDGVDMEEEAKIREETRKILRLPELAISATCVRVPVMVGHAEAVWLETEEHLSASQATNLLAEAPGVRLEEMPSPAKAAGGDYVNVGRIRLDTTAKNGLSLFLACDNLRKGAALNAIQIAELLM